jgi:hypothetical protein
MSCIVEWHFKVDVNLGVTEREQNTSVVAAAVLGFLSRMSPEVGTGTQCTMDVISSDAMSDFQGSRLALSTATLSH